MRQRIATLSLTALMVLSMSAQLPTGSLKERLSQHVGYLASDSLRGRRAGTPDGDKARAYLLEQYEAMGLQAWRDTLTVGFYWDGKDTPYTNIVGVIPGSDPALKDEYIVLGAHYDHIGMKNDSVVYNGADDNASGSAALVEIARELLAHRAELKRSVIIAAFDAEELGLYGSSSLAKMMKDASVDVRLMMSIDMVGWLKAENRLTLEGTGTISHGKQLLTDEADRLGLNIRCVGFEKSILTATDTEGFAKNGVPTLAVSTGLKSPYHKPGDDADLIDYDGMALVTDYLTAIALRFACDTEFGPSGRLSFKHERHPDYGFRLAVLAGAGSSGLSYPKDAAVVGRDAGCYDAGLSVRFNMKHLALVADAIYGNQRYLLPDPTNPFSQSLRYDERSLTVPLTLALQTRPSKGIANAWIGAGAWYRHTLGSRYMDSQKNILTDNPTLFTFNGSRDSFGWQWGFGYSIYDLAIEFQGCFSSDAFFLTPDNARVKAYTRMAHVKWYF